MSLRVPVIYCIPDETERVARAAFPHGNPYLQIADELGALYAHSQFQTLFSATGHPALDPARLAAITIFQFMEGLADAQAADAVRSRIDWKYALALPLTDPGFDSSVLTEFRARLVTGGAEALLLDTLLERVQERGLLKARGRARTDSTAVLAAVRVLTRLVCVAETLRAALNALATLAPEWLCTQISSDWGDRYSRRLEEYHLPKSETERALLAQRFGADGHHLLGALYAPTAPPLLRRVPAVQILRAVWVQQFAAPATDGVVQWRSADDLPPGALLIVSPYDAEARLSAKRGQLWSGYKVHWTESCDEDGPHLITHVATASATEADIDRLPAIHAGLAASALLPAEHYVDSGYVSVEDVRVSAAAHQVQLIGPVRPDSSWQAAAGAGFAAACFAVDWQRQQVTCPAGQTSSAWRGGQNAYGKEVIEVRFAAATCTGCAVRAQCTKTTSGGRGMMLQAQEDHLALAGLRAVQHTAAWKTAYAVRAGIEGTLSQGVRLGDLRQSRYIGAAKTHLQHILIAVAVNLLRLVAWWQERPLAATRRSAFAALRWSSPPGNSAAAI